VGALSVGTLNASAGTVVLGAGASSPASMRALSMTSGASVDLNDNAMVIDYAAASSSPLPQVRAQIAAARNGGHWDAPGLTSSSARANASTTLAAIEGSEFHAMHGAAATFAGVTVDDSAVLVKYTYYGDTDLNGRVNFDDYVRTDNGFNNHLSGWMNGDFDGNGQINFDDYVLIDLAFNTQSGTLNRALAFLDGSDRALAGTNGAALARVEHHFQQFGDAYARGFLAAVPEPVVAVLLPVLTAMHATARRRRRA